MTALSLLCIGRLASRSLLLGQSRISVRSPSSSSATKTVTTRLSQLRHASTTPSVLLTNHSHASREHTLLTESSSSSSSSSSSLSSHSGFLVARRSLATLSSLNTLSLIKKLRTQSGAPIVDCKKALQAAEKQQQHADDQKDDEDAILEAAMDWLREHGAAKAASKVQGRESLQGLVALQIAPDGKSAALVKVASETDFAAQSEKFVQLVVQVANAALQVVPSSASSSSSISSTNVNSNNEKDLIIQEIEKVSVEQQGKTTSIKDLLDAAIVAIRENISIAQAQKLENDDNDDSVLWVGYVHNRVNGTNAGTAAAVVQLAIDADAGDATFGSRRPTRDDLLAVGKKLAMHIVAARPQFLSMDTVPADILDKEREMIHKQIVEQEEKDNSNNSNSDSSSDKKKKSKKPPEIIAKIAEGKLRKFLAQVCLMDQSHMIEEENPIVSKVLKQQGIVIKRFETMSIE